METKAKFLLQKWLLDPDLQAPDILVARFDTIFLVSLCLLCLLLCGCLFVCLLVGWLIDVGSLVGRWVGWLVGLFHSFCIVI